MRPHRTPAPEVVRAVPAPVADDARPAVVDPPRVIVGRQRAMPEAEGAVDARPAAVVRVDAVGGGAPRDGRAETHEGLSVKRFP